MRIHTGGHRRRTIAFLAFPLALAAGCASSHPTPAYEREMSRMGSLGAVAKQAWSDINDARGRGEDLDSAYVVDAANLYLLTIMAGVDMADAVANHRASYAEADQKLDAAEKLLAKMVASGRAPRSVSETRR
jgi:hypothetical protein